MTSKEQLVHEIEDAPETLIQEALDFIRYLKHKRVPECLEPALLSEASLARDWLGVEEDQAWRNL